MHHKYVHTVYINMVRPTGLLNNVDSVCSVMHMHDEYSV